MRASKRKRDGGGPANRRKGQILAAAIELFSRYGFYETEVEAIAKVAGVSKGTVYNHFANKHALFMETVELGIERISKLIDESTRDVADPASRLETAVDAYLSFLRENRHLYRILFLHRSTGRDAEELRFAERLLSHFSLFERILADGVERKTFRRVDVRMASFAITGMILAAHRAQLSVGAGKAPAGAAFRITKLIFDGLAGGHSKPEDVPVSPA
ncbi:MAG: TetR/AcrR family transcriptional regulator [Candidatus Krumholzibacteria bacterium]|nr:TetR/AcrR family transcriptional regulator [Candidatus Krumholzibacteria bacterium]